MAVLMVLVGAGDNPGMGLPQNDGHLCYIAENKRKNCIEKGERIRGKLEVRDSLKNQGLKEKFGEEDRYREHVGREVKER